MADTKITALTELNETPSGSDLIPIVDVSATGSGAAQGAEGQTKKVTRTNLVAGLAASSHTHTLSEVTDSGTAAAKNIPATGDAASTEVVMGDDSRLTDARTPSSHTHSLSDITDEGTAASKNVPSSGDASSTEVVLGSDSRLSDARTPSSHTHAISEVTDLTSSLSGKQATITGAATTIDDTNLTADRAVVSNSSGKVAVSDVTSTELGYLDGVSSDIQTQLNAKQATITTLGETNGGTNQSTYATGDILYASNTNTLSKLAADADGMVLKLSSGKPAWGAASGTGDVSKVGTTVENELGVWTGDGTLGSEANLTYDGTSLTVKGATPMVLEGASGTYTTSIAVTDQGEDRTITLPDATGTVSLTSHNHDTAYQPADAQLDDLAGLAVTDGTFIVGDGSNWVAETGATARTSLGVDAAGTDNSTPVTLDVTSYDYLSLDGQEIALGQVNLATDVTGAAPVANGGTGLSAITSGHVLYASGTDTIAAAAPGSASGVQAYDADTAKTDTAQAWTLPQRTALLTDNDGSFDLSAKQNFFCTPGTARALTFTNPQDGQSGFVKLVNAGAYSHTAHTNTKIHADDLTAIGAAGTFLLGYLSDGTDTWVTVSKALT